MSGLPVIASGTTPDLVTGEIAGEVRWVGASHGIRTARDSMRCSGCDVHGVLPSEVSRTAPNKTAGQGGDVADSR